MKKKLLICLSVLLFGSVFVAEFLKEENMLNNQVEEVVEETKTINTDEEVVLYAGVERIVNITQEHVGINSKKKDEKLYIGYTTARVNIRENPNVNSKPLDIFSFNTMIEYKIYDDKWALIEYDGKQAFVYRAYISSEENSFIDYSVPKNKGFKSYMSYKTITNKDSSQYELQKSYAYTGNYGIRTIYNRYCIAVGTYFDASVGTYVDLILDNGTVIPCIIADIKADEHTNVANIVTLHNGCVTEFLVDVKRLDKNAKRDGDISSCREDWNSPVVRIKVYNKNIL